MKKSELKKLIIEVKQELHEDNLKAAKKEAQKISKEEGVVQHVNMISNNKYKVEDFYDSDTTVSSYENGREL
jgi:hypothetical protein